MIVFLEYTLAQETLDKVKALCEASNLRDVELQGNPIEIVSNDYSYVEELGTNAIVVYRAIMKIISGEAIENIESRYGNTIFGVSYEK